MQVHVPSDVPHRTASNAGMHTYSVVYTSGTPLGLKLEGSASRSPGRKNVKTGAGHIRTCKTTVARYVVGCFPLVTFGLCRSMNDEQLHRARTEVQLQARPVVCKSYLPWTATVQKFNPSAYGFGALAAMVAVCSELLLKVHTSWTKVSPSIAVSSMPLPSVKHAAPKIAKTAFHTTSFSMKALCQKRLSVQFHCCFDLPTQTVYKRNTCLTSPMCRPAIKGNGRTASCR